MKNLKLASLTLIVSIASITSAFADTVELKDGTVQDGTVVSETVDHVTLVVKMGAMRGTVVIPRGDVAKITLGALREDNVPANAKVLTTAAEAQTEPGKAAQAWLLVGGYYDRHPGYGAHARASYEKVLLFDADNPTARERLGFVKVDGAWKKPEPAPALAADEQLAIGKAPAVAADEITIGLRNDAAVIKELLEDQAARQQLQRDLAQQRVVQPPPVIDDGFGLVGYDYGYGYRPTYILNSSGLFLYDSGLGYGGSGFGGFGGHQHHHHSHHQSGVNFNFQGDYPKFRFNAGFNSGFHGSSGYSGFSGSGYSSSGIRTRW
jgi:hypothetical protein